MKVHFRSPITIEFEGWPDTNSQQALADAPRWHQRLQNLRCALGLHYFAEWSWEHGHVRQFRMCQRWSPHCWTTDYHPQGKHNYTVTFPPSPFVMLRFRFLNRRRRHG